MDTVNTISETPKYHTQSTGNKGSLSLPGLEASPATLGEQLPTRQLSCQQAHIFILLLGKELLTKMEGTIFLVSHSHAKFLKKKFRALSLQKQIMVLLSQGEIF